MPTDRLSSVLLFGAPGTGKGTQGKILGQIPGFYHMASGDAFRSLDPNSAERREADPYISRGELVPDDLTIRIWKKAVDERIASASFKLGGDLLVLDGIPRTVAQAEILEEHIDVLRVVYLFCSDEDEAAMVKRIKGRALQENRADDAKDDVIRHRFEVYRRDSEPVLEHYSQELISRVDAIGSPAEVLQGVLACLIPVQNARLSGQMV